MNVAEYSISEDGKFLVIRVPLKTEQHVVDINALVSISRLSKREKQAFDLILVGKCNKEIAAEMGCALRTAKYYCGAIFKKLKLTDGKRELFLKYS